MLLYLPRLSILGSLDFINLIDADILFGISESLIAGALQGSWSGGCVVVLRPPDFRTFAGNMKLPTGASK
jgi:hypothetical protein